MARDGFLRRLWARRPVPRTRRLSQSCTPSVLPLEGRVLQALITSKWIVNVHPGVLPPTSGAFLPVHVYGQIASTRPETPVGFFFVTDEYRRDEPSGPIALGPATPSFNFYVSTFDFTIYLQAKRSTKTMDGRHYDLFVGAKDSDNTDGKTVAIYVPKVYTPPRTTNHSRSLAHHQTRPKS
jgi:hypothetical protein